MTVAIAFGDETEQKCRENEHDHSFLRRSEAEFLPDLIQFEAPTLFRLRVHLSTNEHQYTRIHKLTRSNQNPIRRRHACHYNPDAPCRGGRAGRVPSFVSICVHSWLFCRYCPRGAETSVPAGGVNSNIDAGTGSRV
jgi:hypothetical protein